MKVNLDQELIGFDGKVIPNPNDENKPWTFRAVSTEALMLTYHDEAKLTGAAKLQRHILATRVNDGGKQDMSIDELSLLKELVGKAYGPRIVGPFYQAIDGKNGNGSGK